MLQPAADSETKLQHSPGSIQSGFSPSSQFSRHTSPPVRQSLYTEAYSEQLRLVISQSLNSLVPMESLSETTQRLGEDGRLTSFGERNRPRSVMVVVDATKELTLAALIYAVQKVVRPGDHLYLLGVLHQILNPMGYKQKADDKTFGGINRKQLNAEVEKKKEEFQDTINDEDLQNLFASKQVSPDVKIAHGPSRKEVTAAQARELGATYIILDKSMKKDKQYLKEHLNCNILIMEANNKSASLFKSELPNEDSNQGNSPPGAFQDPMDNLSTEFAARAQTNDPIPQSVNAATLSSTVSPSALEPCLPQVQSVITSQLKGSESQAAMAPSMAENNSPPRESEYAGDEVPVDSDRELTGELEPGILEASSEVENDTSGPFRDDAKTLSVFSSAEIPIDLPESASESTATYYQKPSRAVSTGDLQSLTIARTSSGLHRSINRSSNDKAGDELMNILNNPSTEAPTRKAGTRTLQDSLQEDDPTFQEPIPINDGGPFRRLKKYGNQNEDNRLLVDNSHGRKKNPRPVAPLCSVCKHPGPVFGVDARQFTYAELQEATNDFDQENYLAEGGYGFVYRGRLSDGQEIAVKQYKAASSQGDDEFYSEVNVLKHAQHRNLVILIGYCIENQRRLLVYEFVCNKSLDVHLSAKNPNVLKWEARWRIAVGAARGLRYLHEECRVGCIVHRDMRPNNILLTHDFVPMVGDFGLARSQSSGDDPEETRVIGTLGYLAPEYAESGSITEKADVYSFGVVLLELITGRKAIDATRVRGETCLTEWARPLIQPGYPNRYEIVDPRLNGVFINDQVDKMIDAARRCIGKEKDTRPRMSEVLRLLEQETGPSTSAIPMPRLPCNEPNSGDLHNPPKRQLSADSLNQSYVTKGIVLPNPRGLPLRTMSSQKDSNDMSPMDTKTPRKSKISKEFGINSHDQNKGFPRVQLKPSLSPSGKQSAASSPATRHQKPVKLSYEQML